MSGVDRHSEPQQHRTAAEYRQAADEHVRTLKDFWKDFLVSGLFVLAAIVAIFACLAWFAANNRVSATGSTIGAKADRYTIVAASDDAAHVGYYERTDAEKQNITGLDTTDAMTVTLGSNLNNESAGSLYPGARGKITFKVTPLADDLNGVTINLSRVLKATGVSDDGIVTDGTTLTEAQTLLGLTKGHLLFFTSCDQNGYYSGRVANCQITIDKKEFCDGGDETKPTNKSVTINLYWVWPEYFQNFVLTGNTNYYKNLFTDTLGADYGSLQADMNANKTNYFYGAAGTTAAASAPAVSANMSSADTAICSALYNNADELIGKKVQYIQLRISAQEGVSS